jgi:hypothetical protein
MVIGTPSSGSTPLAPLVPKIKLNDALVYIDQAATRLGKEGWKMVSHNATVTRTDGSGVYQSATLWQVTAYLARPLRPGS